MNRLALAPCSLALFIAPLAHAQSPLTLEDLFPAGVVNDPVVLTAPQDDARIFIAGQDGVIHIVDQGVLLPAPFLDLSSVITYSTFVGFRALTFHPDYASNGRFFVWYDAPPLGAGLHDAVLTEFTVSAGDPNVADVMSLREVIRIPQTVGGHGGGMLAFGHDGMLYASIGDGGEQGDPNCNAQNGAVLSGKVLRLDVDGTLPYEVPTNNPFTTDPTVLNEIWHLGLRNAWRGTFDRLTGDLYLSDVGQNSREEVNFVPAGVGGLNFGWKVEEGTHCYSTASCAAVALCGAVNYTEPIHDYTIVSAECSIIGGYVFRGSSMDWMRGAYFFTDWCSGRVWSLRHDGTAVTQLTEHTAELGGALSFPVSFGEDAAGELYVIQQDGRIARITSDDPSTSLCSGDGGDQLGCTDCPCANNAPIGTIGGCLNSAATSPRLLASGDPSVTLGAGLTTDLRFGASGLPPIAFSILNSGDSIAPQNMSNPCFGLDSGATSAFYDGLRCAVGNTRRHGGRSSDSMGDIGLTNNPWGGEGGPPAGIAASAGGFSAGQTRNFQLIHRDDPLLGCQRGLNTSQAAAVTFTP